MSKLEFKRCLRGWGLLLLTTLPLAGWGQTWELLGRTVATPNSYHAGFTGTALAPGGDILVVGGFGGTVQLGNLGIIGPPGGYSNGLVARFAPAAQRWQWYTNPFNPSGGPGITKVLALPDGDLLVLGTMRGGYAGNVFGNFPITYPIGIADGFVARLDGATGQGRWLANLATRQAFDLVQATAMTLGTSGDLVVTGWFRNQLQLGALPVLVSARPGALGSADNDLFVARLDLATGRWLQGFRAGGQLDDFATDIVALPGGDVALAGYGRAPVALGTLPAPAGTGPRAFVARLDPVGQQWRWAAAVAGQPDSLLQSQSLAVLPGGDLVLSGKYGGTVQLGSTRLDRGAGPVSTLVARLRGRDGSWQWAVNGAGTGRPLGSGSLAVSPFGDVWVASSFSGRGRFGSLPAVQSQGIDPDMFVAELAGDDGSWRWVSTAGGDGGNLTYTFRGDDAVGDLRVLDSRHLLLSGAFCNNATLGNGQVGPLASVSYDGFLARLTLPQPCPDTVAAAAGVRIVADSLDCATNTRLLRVVGAPVGSTFGWSNGASGAILAADVPGHYQVQVYTPVGCRFRLGYTALAPPGPWGTPPNIITPNGDAYNERWVVPGLSAGTRLRVFNRWGRPVYQAASYANDWAATGLAAGTYYYVLDNTQRCVPQRTTGWVEVVR